VIGISISVLPNGKALDVTLFGILRFIASHPLNRTSKARAIGRFLRWQAISRLRSTPTALPFIDDTTLVCESGMVGATGNYYCGLHEPDDMGFVLHFLRRGDLFLDVGANVGSYTVLAAGAVGATVIAVEPIAATFDDLARNIRHNHLAAEAHCVGLSSEAGEMKFITHMTAMNRVALPEEENASTTVPVTTLDEICSGRVPRAIKIDVEGHEASVLAGAMRTLRDPALAAVLLETNGSGVKFGVSDNELVATMAGHGFTPCRYEVVGRTLSAAGERLQNTIFVRDPAAVQATCKASRRYRLVNGEV
jgi:FkbM family methyltransferase